MGQNGLDHEPLFLEIDARDEPVFVSTDVEDERAGGRCVIRGRERLLDRREMRPKSGAYDGRKPLQRLTGAGVSFRESRDDGLTENPHASMFPFMGTLVKANPPTPLSGACFYLALCLRGPAPLSLGYTYSHKPAISVGWRPGTSQARRQGMAGSARPAWATEGNRARRKITHAEIAKRAGTSRTRVTAI